MHLWCRSSTNFVGKNRSLFLLFFVFLLLHPAFVMFRSLVPARDDVSQALCCSVGVYLFLDRRTCVKRNFTR